MKETLAEKLNAEFETAGSWWSPRPEMVRWYFKNVMNGMKVWIEFTDADKLEGAEVKARCDLKQHPNWIEKTEAQHVEKFEGVLESIDEIRAAAGLSRVDSDDARLRAEMTKQAAAAVREETHREHRTKVREDAMAEAEGLADLTNRRGNVDLRFVTLPADKFLHLPAAMLETIAARLGGATKTKTLNALDKAGIAYREALVGFDDKKTGRGGRHTTTVPSFDGVVIETGQAAKVEEIAGGPLADLYRTEIAKIEEAQKADERAAERRAEAERKEAVYFQAGGAEAAKAWFEAMDADEQRGLLGNSSPESKSGFAKIRRAFRETLSPAQS